MTARMDNGESRRRAQVINECLIDGYAPPGYWGRGTNKGSAIRQAAHRLGIAPGTLFANVEKGSVTPDWTLFKEIEKPAIPAPPLPNIASMPPVEPAVTALERREITGLKSKVSRLEAQLREIDQDELSAEFVREQIFKLAAHNPTPPNWMTATPSSKSGISGVPSTIWSDWHLGEVVRYEETNGANEFNLDIAEKRIKKLVASTLDLCYSHMTNPNYPGIVVNINGDIVSGMLHPELAESDELDIFPGIIWALDRIIWALDQFLLRFPHVHVIGVPGNHGRVFDRKPRAKGYVYWNADWLLYNLIERHYKSRSESRITFSIPATGEALYKVYNTRYMAMHGDDLGVKGGDGIIGAIGPIMRGEIKTRHSSATIGRDYDVLLIGHWHQELLLPRVIVNNTLKGADEYARRMLRAVPTAPSQVLWFTHPKHGITARWSVQVGERSMPGDVQWLSVVPDQR